MEHYHLLITVHIIWSSLSLSTGRADNGIHGINDESCLNCSLPVLNRRRLVIQGMRSFCLSSCERRFRLHPAPAVAAAGQPCLPSPPSWSGIIDCDISRLILEHLDWANIKYLQELRALCWMKRVSSWSRKSFLHSPQVKVSPPTTVGSEKKELDVVKNIICVWFQLSVEGASLPVHMRFWVSLGQMTLLQSQ